MKDIITETLAEFNEKAKDKAEADARYVIMDIFKAMEKNNREIEALQKHNAELRKMLAEFDYTPPKPLVL